MNKNDNSRWDAWICQALNEDVQVPESVNADLKMRLYENEKNTMNNKIVHLWYWFLFINAFMSLFLGLTTMLFVSNIIFRFIICVHIIIAFLAWGVFAFLGRKNPKIKEGVCLRYE